MFPADLWWCDDSPALLASEHQPSFKSFLSIQAIIFGQLQWSRIYCSASTAPLTRMSAFEILMIFLSLLFLMRHRETNSFAQSQAEQMESAVPSGHTANPRQCWELCCCTQCDSQLSARSCWSWYESLYWLKWATDQDLLALTHGLILVTNLKVSKCRATVSLAKQHIPKTARFA